MEVLIHLLQKGKAYKELPDVYHIYITMNDFIGGGQTVYEIFRTVRDRKEHTARSIRWKTECMSCISIWKFHWMMAVN